ncbi:MAG: trehalose-phosphatase [Bacteroidota bacterium]
MTQPLLSRGAWKEAEAALDAATVRRPALVVFDFDGTLAPIVMSPDRVRVPAETMRAIEEAARLPRVRIAALSARPMRDLARYLPVRRVLRVAQYGLEGGDGPGAERRRRIASGVKALRELLTPIASSWRGTWIEDKRLTIALHYRRVSAPRRGALLRALARVVSRARRLGFHPEPGRMVLDFVPSGYDKGRALRMLANRVRPAVLFYFGDTAGDEPAFAALGRSGFAVRVGPGPTKAPYRVRGPRDVARFLRAIAARGAAGPRRTGDSNEEVSR